MTPEPADIVGLPRRRPGLAPFKSVAAFCAEYVPLAYTLEPMIRTSSLYTVTAKTGGGKTGFLVVLVLAVATGRPDILGAEVTCGRVVYLAFENPDDVRMRIMTAAYLLGIDLDELVDSLIILDVRMKPEEVVIRLRALARDDGFALIVGDTLSAWFDGRDINDNVQSGEFMRRLRPLTQLPGLPSVVVAAHPVKNAADDNLLPYGGGAILNEVDGNLTLAKKADGSATVLNWQAKFRGLEFPPRAFRFEMTSTPDIVDVKGRQVTLPTLRPITDEDSAAREQAAANRERSLLRALASDPAAGQRGWATATGIPLVTINRMLIRFEKAKLAEQGIGGRWRLTPKGSKEAAELA